MIEKDQMLLAERRCVNVLTAVMLIIKGISYQNITFHRSLCFVFCFFSKYAFPVFGYFRQVRKEYGKCLRTHCCSAKSVDSSIGSVKGSASRAPGRYSSGSQVETELYSVFHIGFYPFIHLTVFFFFRQTKADF